MFVAWRGKDMAHPFDIPEGLFERAEAAAEARGLPLRRFLLDAIIEAVEDVEDAKLADEAMERIRNGEDETYTLSELEEMFALEDKGHHAGRKAAS